MYLALAPLVGALVTLMTGLNSRLSARVRKLAMSSPNRVARSFSHCT